MNKHFCFQCEKYFETKKCAPKVCSLCLSYKWKNIRKPKLSREEVFWSRIKKMGENECWDWVGRISTSGYGTMGFKGKEMIATHIALLVIDGVDVPSGMEVCHCCDNPKCVNPNHLFIGTHMDNMRDMSNKWRASRWKAKLTDDQVREIRILKKRGCSNSSLGLQFGLDETTISNVANYRSYGWVDPENLTRSPLCKNVLIKGEGHGVLARLTPDDVRKIRQMKLDGYLHKDIAVMFKVGLTVVTNIINYKKWKHVDPELAPSNDRKLLSNGTYTGLSLRDNKTGQFLSLQRKNIKTVIDKNSDFIPLLL